MENALSCEPLGRHLEFRRLGLGRAIVQEVLRRSSELSASSVTVWSSHSNEATANLYRTAGRQSRRVLREYRRALAF